jgi:hypothetical protein
MPGSQPSHAVCGDAESAGVVLVACTKDQATLARLLDSRLNLESCVLPGLSVCPATGAVTIYRPDVWDVLRQCRLPWDESESQGCYSLLLLGLLLATGGETRLKSCAATRCGALFVDPTNAVNRRHCRRHVRRSSIEHADDVELAAHQDPGGYAR